MIAEVEKVLDEKATTEWLPISEISVDKSYQRGIGADKIKSINANYNPIAVGLLIVNVRENGAIVIIDGQHRLEVMKKRGILLAECKVCHGLTLEQEAQIFVYCNTVRKNPSALDVFRARLTMNDETANAIVSIVERCGLSIIFFGTGGRQGRQAKGIFAVGTLEEIYTRKGDKFLEEVLRLITRCWPDNGSALDWLVLKGVAEFHMKYKGKYSPEDLIRRMNREELQPLLRRAKSHAEIIGGSGHTTFAIVMQEAYDKGRRTHRLEPNKA